MNKIKASFLVAVMAFAVNAFSQTSTDFKAKEIYDMLGMDPGYCIAKLKAKGFVYSNTVDDGNVYTMNGNQVILNYQAKETSVNVIVYGTMDYKFLSSLRVFLQVGFYRAKDDNIEAWENAKGTKKIFIREKSNSEDQTQYLIAFKNVDR